MKTYNYKTQYKNVLGDLHTPVSTYLKVRDLFPQSALMESSDYHGSENNRSFIGLDPVASIGINHGIATMTFPDGTVEERPISKDYRVENAISDFLARFRVEGEYSNYCGLYGYTTFNAVRYFEDIAVKDSRDAKNDAPDMLYILYRYLIVFNDFRHELLLVEMMQEGDTSHLNQIEKAVNNRNFTTYDFRAVGETTSTLTDEEHKANIRRGIAHCLRGDVFQIVLSRRFVQRYEGDDFKLYRALRSINPSPYLFYFDFGGFRIFGSSPETHCKIEESPTPQSGGQFPSGRGALRATIDPIAGTTRRTGNKAEDARLTAALLADPKENAEHVMLVDLARNDLSRNCHDVKVEFYKEPQYYSHVIHLVSRVSGELDEGANPIKAFIDTFPAGTLSGAPKVRAMQLISEYEPHSRGAYGGCIGFIGLNGTLNQAITIRTFVSRNNELWFQAGGGIVAKSNEEQELQEVNNKLGALKKAIVLAEQM
ncbi:MAG: anthranilate synthase component I family protein [Bacteroides sp.]|nr:anthranilate synthase component I family protein [Bacteroides sp.]